MGKDNKQIRILSPSGAIESGLVEQAAARLRQWGYRVNLAPHALGQYGRFAATPRERLADLNAALADTDTDIILCSRGGYGLQQIADQIVLPNRHTPLVVGFSDITVLHCLLGQQGIPSLHASMCKYLATLPDDHPALYLLQRALQGEKTDYALPPHPLQREGCCTGLLVGGNLSVLYGLQETPYALHRLIDTCPQPPLLLIEDIGEKHYHIDRMMQNLRMSGVLKRIGGLVVGQMTRCEDDPLMGCSLLETIRQAVAEYDYPVLFGLKAGHCEDNIPLRLHVPHRMTITPHGARLQEL